jgi:excinuclease ABC subunit A
MAEYEAVEGLRHVDKVIDVDQSPIGRTPRSNPATFTGIFTHIRDLFAGLPESKARGYRAGRYSFNVKGGRCEACQDDGIVRMEMHFRPDVYVKCEACGGRRYSGETLEVKYRQASIADVLDMTVSHACGFLENIPKLRPKLLEHQVTIVDCGQRPPDDESCKQVNDRSQVELAATFSYQ